MTLWVCENRAHPRRISVVMGGLAEDLVLGIGWFQDARMALG